MKTNTEITVEQKQVPVIRLVLACNFSFIIGLLLFGFIYIYSGLTNHFLSDFLKQPAVYYDPENTFSYLIKRAPLMLLTAFIFFVISFGIGWLYTRFYSKNWRGINLRKNTAIFFSMGAFPILIGFLIGAYNGGMMPNLDLIMNTFFFSLAPVLLIINNTPIGTKFWNKFAKRLPEPQRCS
jgi:hypothetical protein